MNANSRYLVSDYFMVSFITKLVQKVKRKQMVSTRII